MPQVLKKDAKNLLKKNQIRPSKRLGQNFLIDKATVRRIISVANLNSNDITLEVGPGTGILTRELAKKAKRVIAVEKDQKMAEVLEKTTKQFKNVKIIQGDILKISTFQFPLIAEQLQGAKRPVRLSTYKVVANLPYYIVQPLLRKFLESKNPPREMVLMVQKEVGQRICAKPPKMSLLAISVQLYADPRIICYVSKSSFWPKPKVDSAIIRITVSKEQKTKNKNLFFKIVKAGFSQPRKQLSNNLSKGLKVNRERIKEWLLKNKIRPESRAETLGLEDWLRLVKTYIFA